MYYLSRFNARVRDFFSLPFPATHARSLIPAFPRPTTDSVYFIPIGAYHEEISIPIQHADKHVEFNERCSARRGSLERFHVSHRRDRGIPLDAGNSIGQLSRGCNAFDFSFPPATGGSWCSFIFLITIEPRRLFRTHRVYNE